jgi:regulator of cell morphogenesis and NO signaling
MTVMTMTQIIPQKMLMQQHKVDYNSWPLDWLANYIEKLQRKTVTEKSEVILQNISLIRNNCGKRNNYFLQLEELFTESVNRLSAHMKKEEQHLFPFIREMVQAKELNRRINRIELDRIEWLIEILNDEHDSEKKQLLLSTELRENCVGLSNFSKPVSFLLTVLTEFEKSFELHTYLQINFLFPKIITEKYAVA